MSRDVIQLTIDDVSAFAKRLRAGLRAEPEFPGHVEMLGHIARAAGFQNYQHLRAGHEAPAPEPAQRASQTAAPKALERALRVFDAAGVMEKWPKHYSAQRLSVWAFWAALPSKVDLSEQEVNEVLKAKSSFGDHVLLRRTLIDVGLVQRTTDGRIYRRIEQAPPPEARHLIQTVRARWPA